MRKRFFLFKWMLVSTFIIVAQVSRGGEKDILYADPTIYLEGENCYLIGTRNREPLGFTILQSKNLKKWQTPVRNEACMILSKGAGSYGTDNFWAPQIIKENNMYYLAYAANEQIAIAKSTSLLGPYVQDKIEPVDGSEKNIDPYIFKDDDGKFYLYHVRFNYGNYIWVAELDLKKGKIYAGTLTQCFGETDAWETTSNYKSNPIMEGPTVFKKDGLYYMLYSANHFRNIDYAVGYATAPTPYGPWTKAKGNPIIHRSKVNDNGSGHGDLFQDKKNQYYYVYHVHYSDREVLPRRTRIVPLVFTKDPNTGVYKIEIKKKIIIPHINNQIGNK